MGSRRTRYCFDLDGTICTLPVKWGNYYEARPFPDIVRRIQELHRAGHYIIIATARGATTGVDWRSVTEQQLWEWGVPYHELRLDKPEAGIYIDDRAVNVRAWENNRAEVEEFIFGASNALLP